MLKCFIRTAAGTALVAAPLLLTVSAARAGDDATTLRQEVQELRRTVERLDARLQGVEQRLAGHAEPSTGETKSEPAARAEPTAAKAPEVTLMERWRDVKQGMTVQEVEALLGRPDRTVKLPGKSIWYYSYPNVGNGSVVLAQDGSVIDLQAPPFNTWWGF